MSPHLIVLLLLLLAMYQRATANELKPASILFADRLDAPPATSASARWNRAPDATGSVLAPDGSRALRFERGTTWAAATQPWCGDETWTDYRVEVEILPEKMWAGIDFGVSSDGSSANNLTLIHTEDNRLAFELAGIWGEACSWKLYPIGQQRPPHRPGEWVHLHVDFGDGIANVFVDGAAEPVASFCDLPRTRGGVRLMTYFGSALFRNFRVTALPAHAVRPLLDDPWAFAHGPAAGVLRDWQVSRPHETGWAVDGLTVAIAADPAAWRPALADARGVVDLTALFAPRNESGVAFARTTIHAATAGSRTLRLTYTDALALWCNGERVFVGPPRQWFHPDRAKYGNSRLIPDQFEVSVPLRAGANKLVVRTEITEHFGWGFWMRLVP